MLMTPRNPVAEIYPAADYVHAMAVTNAQRLFFVSGTMGLVAKGMFRKALMINSCSVVQHPDDPR